MKRVFLVYNPNSSQYRRVKTEILSQVEIFKGYQLGKYEIKTTGFEDNVKTFSKLLKNDDLVIAVGGDATAAIAANAILVSKKSAVLSVLPYGNFNDLARTLNTRTLSDALKNQKPKQLYPLSVYVDGEFWRYATSYVTIGMTAEVVKIFDQKDIRKELKKARKSSWRSYLLMALWYFKNRRKKVFLPPFSLNGKKQPEKTSDYAAVNGYSMCRVMKGGRDYLRPKIFRSMTERLTSFPRLFRLMVKSMFSRVPGFETKNDLLEFESPASVEIQAEGEYGVFKDIETIEIKKEDVCLNIIQN